MSHSPIGRHCLFDVVGVSPEILDDPDRLSEVACRASHDAGATVRAVHVEHFEPNGASVLVVLAESHVSMHTYPDHGVALCDAFTCGNPNPMTIAEDLAHGLGGRLKFNALIVREPTGR
jgi:S-adenosylmethionine decarboxylase proenzyme